ncbi:MAG: glycosyltransferase family 39 protein [Deltaproteobacteria bacterium]|nr:glycosyltransferase family 39 protein [Deltaproteobacteria bacterium]
MADPKARPEPLLDPGRERSAPHRSMAMPALLLAGLIAIAGMAWQVRTDQRVLFLRHQAEARWIHVARPFEFGSWRDTSLAHTSEFRVAFELPSERRPSEPAPELTLHALRAVVVQLDGRTLHDDRADEPRIDWRAPRRVALPTQLAAGRHEIRITVSNATGPPLLLAYCEALDLRSGSGWSARTLGGSWAPARDADEIPASELTGTFPPVSEAVGSLALWLAAVFLAVAGLLLAWERQWLPAALRERKWSSGLFATTVAVAWCVLIVNNLPRLPGSMGMDVHGHLEYMQYLSANLALPLASDGWQMFQPPLYYAASVLISRPLLGLVAGDSVLLVLRLFPMLCGLAMVLLCHRVARSVFPERADLRTIATCVGALTPMGLSLSQTLGNEPLAAVWSAWAIALSVEALRVPAVAAIPRKQLALGVVLGLGLLTKVSVLVLVPPILAAGVSALRRSGATWQTTAVAVARVGGACTLVSGWYYVRNWIRLGHPFVGGWDPARGILWWQDPGYRTWEQYLSFGESLIHPIFAGTHGLWDGLHSTMWLDGMLSGKFGGTLPPWNLAPLLAGAWLGLLPLALILIGVGRSLWRAARGESDGLAFSAVAICFGLIAVSWISVTVPTYSAIKATYLLGFLPCFGVLAAAGYEALARQTWPRALLAGGIGCWAVFAYVAYFAIG